MSADPPARGLRALRTFAGAITALTVVGHLFLGFEQSWLQVLVAVATAYCVEVVLELVDSRARGEEPRWRRAPGLDWLLSAHITGLAVALLLYSSDRLLPFALAAGAGIASKRILRANWGGRERHFMNPSNLGISLTLILFPWVGIAPPYHFTEELVGLGDWALPAVIVVSGSMLNGRLTGRLPLVLAWISGFVLQAVARSIVTGTPLVAGLLPITGVAFILFTFYMVTDPSTTPSAPGDQVLFGLAVAIAYGLLMALHVVFGLFFGLTLVCALRGVRLHGLAWSRGRVAARVGAPTRHRLWPVAGVSAAGPDS